ncbi:MAG: hypothetical protein U1C97_00180 [Candidatus Gracilibacteria bacterium]|nr:hypothetical protein [bacterium]MDZ4216719.1 hypothetical protein [Candidatus Gracilibacteria bacterium]
MKYILVTRSFRKQLKKFKRYFYEQDVVEDIHDFILNGLRGGESFLKTQTIAEIRVKTVKLRICVRQVKGRYLLGILGDREYIPLLIDLKSGQYGRNMSFQINRKLVSHMHSQMNAVLRDYLAHTDEEPMMTVYEVDG